MIGRDSNSTFPKAQYNIRFRKTQPSYQNLPFLYALGDSFKIYRYKDINLYERTKIVKENADLQIKLLRRANNYDLYVKNSNTKNFYENPLFRETGDQQITLQLSPLIHIRISRLFMLSTFRDKTKRAPAIPHNLGHLMHILY